MKTSGAAGSAGVTAKCWRLSRSLKCFVSSGVDRTRCPSTRTWTNTAHLLHRLFEALCKDDKDQMLLMVGWRRVPQSRRMHSRLRSSARSGQTSWGPRDEKRAFGASWKLLTDRKHPSSQQMRKKAFILTQGNHHITLHTLLGSRIWRVDNGSRCTCLLSSF